MRTLLFIIAMFWLPISVLAQNTIFETYSNSPEVTYVNIKPKMFQMIANIGIDTDDPEAKLYMDMVKSITSFKTMVTQNKTIALEMSKWVGSRSNNLEALMEFKEDGAKVNFYVKSGNDSNHVKELLIFVNAQTMAADYKTKDGKYKAETIVVAMTGNIDLSQVFKLAQKMNIPGGEHLKQ